MGECHNRHHDRGPQWGAYGYSAGIYGSVSWQIPGLLFADGNPRAVEALYGGHRHLSGRVRDLERSLWSTSSTPTDAIHDPFTRGWIRCGTNGLEAGARAPVAQPRLGLEGRPDRDVQLHRAPTGRSRNLPAAALEVARAAGWRGRVRFLRSRISVHLDQLWVADQGSRPQF